MLFENEIADTLVVFKEDPNEEGTFTDEAIATLMLMGKVVTPEDGNMAICYDITTGYEWKIPWNQIGDGKGYDWLKKCYSRIFDGINERLGKHVK